MAGFMGRNPYLGNMPGTYGQNMAAYWPQYQPPQIMQQAGQAGQASPQMTPPTVHADIIQVADEEAMERHPVDAGTSQMMISRDESVIGVKTVLANGENIMDIYRKQPRAPKAAEPEYVTRAEFERWVAEIRRKETERPALRAVEMEAAEEETIELPAERPVMRTRSTAGGRSK